MHKYKPYENRGYSHGLPHVIEVRRVAQPTPRDRKLRLELAPVAVDPFRAEPPTDVAVARRALRHVLLALAAVHARGWAHRDVRWPNVLQQGDEGGDSLLADFEFAAPHGTKETWEQDGDQPTAARVPRKPTQAEQVPWTAKHDLWQVGNLLAPFAPVSPDANAAVGTLCSLRDDLTAQKALELPFFA